VPYKLLCLVLADQLFREHPGLQLTDHFLMVESFAACRRLPYHKFRLAYILTAMREYADFLRSLGKQVIYYSLSEQKTIAEVLSWYSQEYNTLVWVEIDDKPVSKQIGYLAKKYFVKQQVLPSPKFLTSQLEFQSYLQSKKNSRLIMQDFYVWQRKRLHCLMNSDQTPIGGSWSLDKLNRKRLPRQINLPKRIQQFTSQHFLEVKELVTRYFPNNPGVLDQLWLPINFVQGEQFLEHFLQNSLPWFGDYEDALTQRDDFVFHSVLSPLLNLGLLTPAQVLDRLLQRLKQSPELLNQHLNSVEGFLRQIIGWREWVKGMYVHKYSSDWQRLNFFKASNPLPKYFYQPQLTNPELDWNVPLKQTLLKVHRLAWCHHIERLMVLANWMTLNSYSPKDCYLWFRSQFVDAFEWVMVPNVYGMGLFADGGLFATKPYIAGGNYLQKMGDYSQPNQWASVWTEKFWQFLLQHQNYFSQNPRLNLLLQKKLNSTNSSQR